MDATHLIDELQKKAKTVTKNKQGYQAVLNEEMYGTERLSPLLYSAPSKTPNKFNPNNYGMLINEPLQDISNHIPNKHIT